MKRATLIASVFAIGAAALGLALYDEPELTAEAAGDRPAAVAAPIEKMRLGLNLFGPATYNRQQVFTNLIAQSEWFASRGAGWQIFPVDRLDQDGWVRSLEPGQSAPRPLILPPAPFRPTQVRCRYEGKGALDAGGLAQVRERGKGMLLLGLAPTGNDKEAAWIELTRTDPADPVRRIDCRETDRPQGERFHPDFLGMVKDFAFIRFLDWQRVNDNADVRWANRTRPDSSSQVGPMGVSIEDMVDLANQSGADPWFLMPYKADEAYIRGFAQLVRRRLAPERRVYVELGNEIWNDQFDAAQQARREGLALKLGDGDPGKAQMRRYAQKLRTVMAIWTQVFADQPHRLIRVAASQNANPDLAETILTHGDTARWVDGLATAPYIWIALDGYGSGETDRVFAQMPRAIDATFAFARANRDVARRHGKRFLTYEGGQHLLTKDMALAHAIQRDPRMGAAYDRYLTRWREEMGGDLALYASTTPISEYGSWGLLEYGGQPLGEAPKMQAVRRFLKGQR